MSFTAAAAVVPVLLPLLVAPLMLLLGQRSRAALLIITVIGIGWALLILNGQVLELGPQRYAVGGWGAPLGIDLYADGLAMLMLWLTWGVGSLVSGYALVYFAHGEAKAERFWPIWLLLWMSLNALFLAADIFNLYVTLELLTLAAVPLAALTGETEALRASMRYLLFALLGSFCYMLGVALLYGGFGTLDIMQLGWLVTPGPLAWVALALITLGLLIKAAIFPFHVWLPPAHANAPTPVSALLSALVVKGALYLLVRIWFQVFPNAGTLVAGQLLGLLGAMAILYGSWQALRQVRLKLLVAYSTVAQLGYFLLVFPLANATGWGGAILQLLSHGFAKAALFLAAGNVLHALGHDRIAQLHGVGMQLPITVFTFALAGIGIMSMPPSGGFLAKWLLLRAALESGQWWWAIVLLCGGLLAATYVFRVLGYALLAPAEQQLPKVVKPALTLELIPLLLALISVAIGFVGMPYLTLLDIGSPFSGQQP
ncbi:MAG: proton-conducting transporter membrane subunit [Candidatus Competibacteraceae bacterium]|jgi:formate hydrogenlyase subunit 3/multisubunit Na+/H+ antiporter MnhD subunit|nr:proton-conducting transporter membrane subunit [Candidatus Competibacteraceae bacterium]